MIEYVNIHETVGVCISNIYIYIYIYIYVCVYVYRYRYANQFALL